MITEQQQPEDESDSLDAALDAAMSAAAEPVETPAAEAPAAEATEPAAPAEPPTKARDESGKFVKAAPAPKAAAKVETQTAPVATAPAEIQPVAAKAPQSWTPAVREKWAAIPPEVQSEVLRREKEVQRALQESAEERKVAAAYRQTVSPYEAQLRAENTEPMAAVQSLLQTAQALRTAPMTHKAAIAASIIQGHGIPLELVQQHLQGKVPQGQSQAVDPSAIAADVEKRVRQQIEREQQSRAQAEQQAVVEKFAADHEFFADLEPMMVDIVNGRRAAGLPVSLEEAYTLASQLHPGVSSALKQRETAAQAKATQASTQRARAAASSLPRSGSIGKAPQVAQADSLDDALDQAFAAHR